MLGALLPLNIPVRVAEEYAMLDLMTGGRLIAGFHPRHPERVHRLRRRPQRPGSASRRPTDLVLRAWTEPEPFGWEGKHYQFRTVSIWPRPLQQPHPPILMSGGSAESAAFAARKRAMMGVQLSSQDFARELYDAYRDTARADGWEPPRSNLLVGLHTWVARTDAEARKTLGESEEYFYSVLSRPSNHANELVVSGTRYYQSDATQTAPGAPREGHGPDDRRPHRAGRG